jgi:hypothetical protein
VTIKFKIFGAQLAVLFRRAEIIDEIQYPFSIIEAVDADRF